MSSPAAGDSPAAALAAEVRERLGPPPQPANLPPISIVVLNRDGAADMRRLLAGLSERTDYSNLELIVVDNGSRDESLDFIRRVEAPFPISILANSHNESFSDANNQGAELARGELLLFLNNDVEPFEPGWLRELVACLQEPRTGIAGATLLQPDESSCHGYLVQHRAMRLLEDAGQLRADLHGRGDEPLGEGFGKDADSPIAAGACMLMRRDVFMQVGGFTHGYVYGDEDVDLGWKVLDLGLGIVCSGRSLLIHRLGATRAKEDRERQRKRRMGNRRLLAERWGARVRREYEADRLGNTGFWAAPSPAAEPGPAQERAPGLAFWLRSSEAVADVPGDDPVDLMSAALADRGRRCVVARGGDIEGPAGLDCDIAIHFRGPARYIPTPAQLNVLWLLAGPSTVTAIECSRYDLVLTSDTELAARLAKAQTAAAVVLLSSHDAAGEAIEAVLAHAAQHGLPARFPPRPRAARASRQDL